MAAVAISADVLRALQASGATTDMIIAAVEADQREAAALMADRRAKAAAKKRKQRAAKAPLSQDVLGTNGDKGGRTGTDGDLSPPPAPSPKPPTPPAPTHENPRHPSGAAPKADRKSRIAEDAQPDDRDRAAAEASGMDAATFRHEWGRFRDHHRAEGSMMLDWHAAWRKWATSPYRKPMNGHARAGPIGKPSVTSVVNELHEELGFGRH